MKKTLLLAAGLSLAGFANAQNANLQLQSNSLVAPKVTEYNNAVGTNFKVTKNGDTLMKGNFAGSDSLKRYIGESALPIDTGYVAGTNVFGDKAFAERFDISGADSSVMPLGVGLYLTGKATTTSTKVFRAVAWRQSNPTKLRNNVFFTGMPGTEINSVSVPLKNIRKANGTIDSFRIYRFPTLSPYITDSFFVGYDMSYTWNTLNGDTVTCYMTKNGQRHQPGYVVKGADTIVNVQNATLSATNVWTDNLNGGRFGLANHYIMTALFRVKIGVGVNGITRNELSVFGTVPNPATNSATLKMSLKSSADVTLQIVDVAGRTVANNNFKALGSGTHDLPINTSSFAAGTYYCLVRTSNGDAIGVEMVIVK